MLRTPECWKRNCKHFLGIRSSKEEASEVNVCAAFPRGIPDEIAYGDNLHSEPLRNQKNKIVFEVTRVAEEFEEGVKNA